MNITIDALLTGTVRPLGDSGRDSGIDKHPVGVRLWLGLEGLNGDEQADRRFHGGPEKALHHYARDHYPAWLEALGERAVLGGPGAFGENISTAGMTESEVCVGDVYRAGTALIQVSQARQPCWKLDHRFGRRGMAAQVQASGMTGWYYRVLRTGWLAVGDVPFPARAAASAMDAGAGAGHPEPPRAGTGRAARPGEPARVVAELARAL